MQMDNRYIKRFSTSLMIRKNANQSLHFHFIPVRMATIKNIYKITSIDKVVETR